VLGVGALGPASGYLLGFAHVSTSTVGSPHQLALVWGAISRVVDGNIQTLDRTTPEHAEQSTDQSCYGCAS